MSKTNVSPAALTETCVRREAACCCSRCNAEHKAATFATVREERRSARELAALRVGRQLTEEQAVARRAELAAWREQLAAEQGW